MVAAGEFTYRANFPGLTDVQINAADTIVVATWSGLFELWASASQALQQAKQTIMENLLLAHWLAENYPGEVVNAISTGALPMTGQDVGGVAIQFKDLEEVQGPLKGLMTSQWGIQALRMYMGSPERFIVL